MFWRKKPNAPAPGTIHVEYFDASTGKCFAQCAMPLEKLPQSFEAATTMHRGDQDWEVLRAEPMTAAEFSRTGKLKLVMRRVNKIEHVDPSKILFSLPTVSNDLPGIEPGSTKIDKRVIELHEDDWRQVELVSRSLQPQIDEEIAGIERIHRDQRVGPGFKNVHVREEIPSPIATAIALPELREACGRQATWLDGIALHGVAGLVERGFAVKLISSIELYGQCQGDRITVLALQNRVMNNSADHDLESLAAFFARQELSLVNWCAAQQIDPLTEEFKAFFRPAA